MTQNDSYYYMCFVDDYIAKEEAKTLSNLYRKDCIDVIYQTNQYIFSIAGNPYFQFDNKPIIFISSNPEAYYLKLKASLIEHGITNELLLG